MPLGIVERVIKHISSAVGGFLSTYHRPLTFLVFQDILDGTQTVFLGAPAPQ